MDVNNKIVNGEVLRALIAELETKSVGSITGLGSVITVRNLKGNIKNTIDVSINNFLGASSMQSGSSGLVPAPAAGKQDMALCGDATFKVLPITGGGTGASTAKQAREYLEVEPIGTIYAFAGNTLPKGYLPCNGSVISRTTYADLFTVIGTTYGTGDGSTTFNLPNLTDRFIQGSDTVGTVKSAGLPNITGTFYITRCDTGDNGSATDGKLFTFNGTGPSLNNYATYGGINSSRINFNASKSNSVYGNSNTVQPPALTMRYIIKY